jgi:hypothetical protein
MVTITSDKPGHSWLMVRRNDTTGEINYRCYSPKPGATCHACTRRRTTLED